MSKPATANPKQQPKYEGPPVKRIRAIQVSSDNYTLIEETFAGPPTETKVLKEKCFRVSAEDRVRLYLEERLGLNRFGDSGL